MEPVTFDRIWAAIGKRIETQRREIYDRYRKEDERFRFELTYGGRTKDVIEAEYRGIRDRLKVECYGIGVHDTELLDHHKIAACFCKAFIRKKVYMFDVTDTTPQEVLLSNYALAYEISTYILYLYLLYHYLEAGQRQYLDCLLARQTLEEPPTTIGHDSYRLGRIKTLALEDIHGVEMDLLQYSCTMYWLELYNMQLIENKVRVQPLDWNVTKT